MIWNCFQSLGSQKAYYGKESCLTPI
jgi:hypothetical protein